MRPHFSPDVNALRAAHKLKPNYSALARQLGVTPQHVRRVFMGLSTSGRVLKAIQAEIRRKQRQQQKSLQEAA